MEQSKPAQVRAFLAITPSAEVLQAVADEVTKLRRALRDCSVSWEKPDKWHVTMQFLGDVPEDQMPALAAVTRETANSFKRFTATAKGVGVFPNERRPRVLWVGVKDSADALFALNKALHDGAAPFPGRPLDARFHPHLTIARIRADEHAVSRALRSKLHTTRPDFGSWEVAEVQLWRSKLSSGGSVYELLDSFPLSN